jgi:signal transduction histidine kinase
MSERARLPANLALAVPAARRRWMPIMAAGLSIGEYLRSVVRRLALLVALLVLFIWVLSGEGYFWPAWTWLGLGVVVLLDAAAAWAWRRPRGALRRVACVWALVAVAAAILISTWLLTWLLDGARTFWPAWALLGLATAGSAYSLAALHDRVLVARGRRALRARIELLTRTRRQAVDAQAVELRRIERDLHDGAQARLVALTLQLGRAELRAQAVPELRDMIEEAQREAQLAIGELRDLARGIVPPLLADRGLVAAVHSLAARYGLGTAIDTEGCVPLAPAVESAAYFVIAEALTNSAKHADARRTWVRLRSGRRLLQVIVGDDGSGGADPDGSGLAGLRARVEALDGTLRVQSTPGAGTLLEARLPCGW